MVSKRRIASGTKRRVRTYVHIYVFPSFPTTSGWSATEQIDLHLAIHVTGWKTNLPELWLAFICRKLTERQQQQGFMDSKVNLYVHN